MRAFDTQINSRGDGGAQAPFRSSGEAQIARLLTRQKIAYLYEHPVLVVERGMPRIWYPDFQLPDYGLLIEYCGMPEDPRYATGMSKKERVYRENGWAALLVTPQDMRGYWPGKLLDRLELVLAQRLEHFRAQRRSGR